MEEERQRLSDRKQIEFAIAYGSKLTGVPDSENAVWTEAAYDTTDAITDADAALVVLTPEERKEQEKQNAIDINTSGSMRVAFVAIDQAQRYQKTGQIINAFKYYRVGWEIIEHVIDPKKGKDIWIMMMRDSIRVLLALKATELVEILTKATFSVSKHPLNGMIPKMIEILTFHKLTNAITLELLEKKQKEINALGKALGEKQAVAAEEVVEEVE